MLKCQLNCLMNLYCSRLSLLIHCVYNRDMNADRNSVRLPALVFISPEDFMLSGKQNCIVKVRFIVNHTKWHLGHYFCH